MPAANKKQIDLLTQEENVKKRLLALDTKRANLIGPPSKEDIAQRTKLNKLLSDNTAEQQKSNIEGKKTLANLRNLRKETDSYAKSVKKGSDPKFGKFLERIADQSKKASDTLKLVTKDLDALNRSGKGGTDLAKGLQGLIKIEEDILTIGADRSKLAKADIKSMRAAAKQSLTGLKTAGDRTKEEQEHVKLQMEQLNALQRMQNREEAINAAKETQNKLSGQMHDIYMKLTSGPLVLFVTLLEGIKKLVNAVKDITLDVQKNIGGSAAESAKLAANLKAAQGVSRGAAIAASGLGANVRDAQIQAGLAADNMDMMNNASIAVNEAVVSLQSGLAPEQVAELATRMSEVTDLSREAASAQLNSAMAFALQNKVAPAAIMADMAANATELAAMTDGSADSMVRLAVAARKAGMELSAMNSMADGLLNIEESLTKEFEASVLLNRDINLDLARQAALQNDMEGMVGAIQDQLGGMDFGSMDRIQRQALADSVGLSVGDLGRAMSRSGQELEGNVEQQMLKGTKDLAKEAVIHTDKFGKMIFYLQLIAGFVGMGGLGKITKFLGKGGLGKAGAKAAQMGAKGLSAVKNVLPGGAAALSTVDKGADIAKVTKGVATTVKASVAAAKTIETGAKASVKKMAAKEGVEAVSKFGLKKLATKIPLLGLLPTLLFAGMRAAKGDMVGAGLELASGASAQAGPFTGGAGTAGSFAIDAALIARDMGVIGAKAQGGPVSRSGNYMVGEEGPEVVALSKGSHVVPNHMLGGLASGATDGSLMSSTNEKLDKLIGLMSKVDINTNSTATGVNNINIRTGR